MLKRKVIFLKLLIKFFNQGNSYAAAVYYEKYLQASTAENDQQFKPYFAKKNDSPSPINIPPVARKKAIYNLAESYRVLNDYTNAEKWYNEVLTQDGADQFPLGQYWYGITLRANNKPEAAGNAFLSFLSTYKENDEFAKSAKMEIANFPYVQTQTQRSDSGLYKINISPINGKGATYAAAVSNNILYFSSTRPDTTIKLSKEESPYVNNIYQTSFTEGKPGTADKLSLTNPRGYEQGTTTFSASGSRIFFTRWQKINNANISAIYTSEKQGDKWSEPVKLLAEINEEGFSSKEPFVTSDGHLLFSSNRPGGIGKFDLWAATIDSNGSVTGQAKNLGETINTTHDDQCPFYHPTTNTLVFASNGRIGMGGFDLYTSKGTIDGGWQPAINPGYPINSVKDDLYFTTTNNNSLLKNAFISSDRNSSCCLELFNLDKEYKKYISGNVVNCKTNVPVADALIQVMDSAKGRVLFTQLTDASGKYVFDITDISRPLQFAAEKQGYTSSKIAGAKTGIETDTATNDLLCLTPIENNPEPGKISFSPMLLHFDFDKSNIRSDAAVVLDSLAAVMQREPGMSVEIGGYTDGKGAESYNLNLSDERAEACYNYLTRYKNINPKRFLKKAYGACCHVAKELTEDGKDNPEGRQLNRRAEFRITGF